MKYYVIIMCLISMFAMRGQASIGISDWSALERQGDLFRSQIGLNVESNTLASQSKTFNRADAKRWFKEVLSYSITTNEIEHYVIYMNRKINLIRDFLCLINDDDSLNMHRTLIEQLAYLKRLYGKSDSQSYFEAHKKSWRKKHGSFTLDEQKAWKVSYRKDKKLRTALGRAMTDIESMVEKLYRRSSPQSKESLLKMIIDITGETPKWYREELEENVKTSNK